jgi:hypothetical protein
MFNGTYSPSKGRPTSLVKDIGEKMVKNHRDLHAPQPVMSKVPENAIGDEVKFAPREVYAREPKRYTDVPQTEQVYTINDALCNTDNMLAELIARIARLHNKLSPVLQSSPECDENQAPVVSSSPVMERIHEQLRILTMLNVEVERMIGNITL